MKKLIIFGIVIVLLAVIVTAVLNNITDAVFIPEQLEVRTKLKGDITFDCGKTPMSLHFSVSSLEHLDGDFEQEVGFVCDKEVTNVVDWNERTYKSIIVGNDTLRSFDETKLIPYINVSSMS